MKKFAVMLAAVVVAVSLCGVLWADDDDNHPVKTWTDDYIPNMDLFGGSTKPEPSKPKPSEPKTPKPEQKLHPKASYVITKWSYSGDSYTLEISSKSGRKERNINGKSGKGITLRMPIQFTIPEWVTQIHVDEKANYEILDDGTLRELDYFEETDSNGKVHKFRKAYPGDKVLLVNGDGLTLWIRRD